MFDGCHAATGSAVYALHDSRLRFDSSLFANGVATLTGGVLNISNSTARFDKCNFTNNTIQIKQADIWMHGVPFIGGAVISAGTGSRVNLSHSRLEGNAVFSLGLGHHDDAALASSASNASASSGWSSVTNVNGNIYAALPDESNLGSKTFIGGAIILASASISFEDTVVEGNTLFLAGKASTVPNNFAGGGAVLSFNGTIQISDSQFRTNAGPGGGAVAACMGGQVAVERSLFQGNAATTSVGGFGGALLVLMEAPANVPGGEGVPARRQRGAGLDLKWQLPPTQVRVKDSLFQNNTAYIRFAGALSLTSVNCIIHQ